MLLHAFVACHPLGHVDLEVDQIVCWFSRSLHGGKIDRWMVSPGVFFRTVCLVGVARTYRSGHVSISPRFVRTDQVQYRSRVILYPVNSTLGNCGGMNSAILCHTQI